MSADLVVLEKIIEDRKNSAFAKYSMDKFFEIFCVEQLLKSQDLSYAEIEEGIIDGNNDGGIDALYLIINDLLVSTDDFEIPEKGPLHFDIFAIQAKNQNTFKERPLVTLRSTFQDLFDLTKPTKKFADTYRPELIDKADQIRSLYLSNASRFPTVAVHIIYATKGDTTVPNAKLNNHLSELSSAVEKSFSECEVNAGLIGASELLKLARQQPKSTYTLKLAENPISSSRGVSYVSLVNLEDFFQFITDENGKLIHRMFESNVRDYQGSVEVNNAIQNTLENSTDDDFWWLNNGVTILADRANESAKNLNIENPNIVNGLQTSTEIFKFFSNTKKSATEPATTDDRRVLIRVIVPQTTESSDRIIKATNSQTNIPPAQLRATEKIHRDIEDYLKASNLFYDRRKNFYKNAGKKPGDIVSISEMAQAVMSAVLGRPSDARARPSSLLKDDDNYALVFSSDYDMKIYLNCAQLLKRTDDYLRTKQPQLPAKDRNNIKFHLVRRIAQAASNVISPGTAEIEKLSPLQISDHVIEACFKLVYGLYVSLGANDQASKGTSLKESISSKPLTPDELAL